MGVLSGIKFVAEILFRSCADSYSSACGRFRMLTIERAFLITGLALTLSLGEVFALDALGLGDAALLVGVFFAAGDFARELGVLLGAGDLLRPLDGDLAGVDFFGGIFPCCEVLRTAAAGVWQS